MILLKPGLALMTPSKTLYTEMSQFGIWFNTWVNACAIYLDLSVPSMYALIWFSCGLLGTLVHRYLSHGPANPLGESIERETFWIILIFGLLGLVVALISFLMYSFETIPRKKVRKVDLEEGSGTLSYSSKTGLPILPKTY